MPLPEEICLGLLSPPVLAPALHSVRQGSLLAWRSQEGLRLGKRKANVLLFSYGSIQYWYGCIGWTHCRTDPKVGSSQKRSGAKMVPAASRSCQSHFWELLRAREHFFTTTPFLWSPQFCTRIWVGAELRRPLSGHTAQCGGYNLVAEATTSPILTRAYSSPCPIPPPPHLAPPQWALSVAGTARAPSGHSAHAEIVPADAGPIVSAPCSLGAVKVLYGIFATPGAGDALVSLAIEIGSTQDRSPRNLSSGILYLRRIKWRTPRNAASKSIINPKGSKSKQWHFVIALSRLNLTQEFVLKVWTEVEGKIKMNDIMFICSDSSILIRETLKKEDKCSKLVSPLLKTSSFASSLLCLFAQKHEKPMWISHFKLNIRKQLYFDSLIAFFPQHGILNKIPHVFSMLIIFVDCFAN